jgi:hypothetical protein
MREAISPRSKTAAAGPAPFVGRTSAIERIAAGARIEKGFLEDMVPMRISIP